MKKLLLCLLICGVSVCGAEEEEKIKWNPRGQFISVGSSADLMKQLGSNSFVRAICDERSGDDQEYQIKSCEPCTAIFNFIVSKKSQRAQKQDDVLHAVYKLGLQAGRSDKEIEVEQERILNSRPAMTILERSEDGTVEEV